MVLLVKEHADEFPRQQSYYQAVLDLLDKMLQLIRSYITRGRDGRQLVPQYLLDVVDITRGRDGRQLVPRYLLDVVDITRGRDGRQLVPWYLLDVVDITRGS